MPTLTRWFIKASFLYFVLGLTGAVLLGAYRVTELPVFVVSLGPATIHFLMVGWVTQLIFGIVHWMFPKFSRDQPHRSERLAWTTFVLLNGGLVLRAIAEPAQAIRFADAWAWTLVASAFLQWVAGMAFVVNTWGRVRDH